HERPRDARARQLEDQLQRPEPVGRRGVHGRVVGLGPRLAEGPREVARVPAKDLAYSFTNDPDTRFIRKVFIAAGSDAHGDFNFAVSRTATPISIQSTYSVGDDPWYAPRTYCLAEGKPGATMPERALQAYADGSTVCTDGPLAAFTLDADSKFDAKD